MYPNDSQPVTPADYLNQIATKPHNNFDLLKQKPVQIGAIGLGVFIVIVIIAAIFGGLSGGIKPTERLAARLTTTEKTVATATPNLKSTKLRAINSNLSIYLTNTIRDITPILAKNNIKIDKLDKKVTAAESNEKLLAVLEDARLNAIYDRTYAREMAYKLDTILTLMREIYTSTSNKELISFLKGAYTNLQPTQKQFADFNAANS